MVIMYGWVKKGRSYGTGRCCVPLRRATEAVEAGVVVQTIQISSALKRAGHKGRPAFGVDVVLIIVRGYMGSLSGVIRWPIMYSDIDIHCLCHQHNTYLCR